MTHTVDLFVYPDCQLLDASGPWQVFASANTLLGRPHYELRLNAVEPGEVRTNGGMTLVATHALATTTVGGTLLVAGGHGVHELDDTVIRKLAERAASASRVGSICSGAFALARTGLLDGCCVTTHWRQAERLAREFPEIDVAADALYRNSGNLYTSAGVTAGMDLALALVAADHDHRLAGEVARELVMFLHRPGDQAQFSEGLRCQLASHGRLRALIDRVLNDPLADWNSEGLAAAMAVTPRHFQRLFRQQLSMTPMEFLSRLRLESARRLLAESDAPLGRIAEHCRIGGAEQLRRQFQRRYGLAPSAYRARFGRTLSSPAPTHTSNREAS
ncbi:GlxA family transcriptional regulator [Salinicola acroporae]|uniref:AraC family transcriptional regulator n=1 Tax=Salinicola acroporae TaxID=1541440 RepID=A0ABT6I8D9_9GAMM|nr:helix-turn-helix domain-containing protein [Salinicola acroporae]MDH4573985.1 AraC family transcriptional regulator [Salinicola acroporae]